MFDMKSKTELKKEIKKKLDEDSTFNDCWFNKGLNIIEHHQKDS